MTYRHLPSLAELLTMFAMSEEEQSSYFPRQLGKGWIHFADFDTDSEHARFTALCALAARSRKAAGGDHQELCRLFQEINSLARVLIDCTTFWSYLVWHPSDVVDENGFNLFDPEIYGVWDIVRRLCRDALAASGNRVAPLRPFHAVFSEE